MSDEVTTGKPTSAADPATGEEGQIFVLLGWAWDITAAHEAASRHPVRHVAVESLTSMLSIIHTDPDHAAQVNLQQPLLAVPIPYADTPLVIDGWHRIRRAITSGVTHLPVILLDEADERACRIMGGNVPKQR